jgi:hypothetical protein
MEQNRGENQVGKPPFEEPSYCLLCGGVGPALLDGHWVCEHCKNVVQAEAVSKKRKSKRKAADNGGWSFQSTPGVVCGHWIKLDRSR